MSTKCLSRYKKLLTTQVENLHAISHFNTKHLVLWTTPKPLEPQWKNRVKELGIRSGLHCSQKVELSHVKYFRAFISSVNCLPYRWKQWQEKMRDWIGNFWPVWQRTRSESTQDKARSLPPASRDCHATCYIFKKLKFFLHQLNSKNIGPALLFKTILWHWYCFPSSVCCNGLQGLKMDGNLGSKRYRTYSNHLSTRLIQIIYWKWRRRYPASRVASIFPR